MDVETALMPPVLIPINLPSDSTVDHVVAVRTARDGKPIREQLLPVGPVRHVKKEAARPALTVERELSLEDRVAMLERKIAALEPVGVE